jgi:TolB-like protein
MRLAILIALLVSLQAAVSAQTRPMNQPAAAPVDVVVLPFEETSANPTQGWIGQAIQQSLVADLSQMKPLQPQPGEAAARERAIEQARSRDAEYVILGSYQLVEPQVRITGQVIESSTGRVLGGLKSTGDVRELFAMQDTLGTQAKRIVREAIDPPAPAAPAEATPVQQVVRVEVVQPQSTTPPGSVYRGSGLQSAVRRGSVSNYVYRNDYRYSYPGYYYGRYINYTYGYPHFYSYPYYVGWGYPRYVWRGCYSGGGLVIRGRITH